MYYTHDIGRRPFRVEVMKDSKVVNVFDNIQVIKYEENKNYNKKIYSTKYTNIWIGKTPKKNTYTNTIHGILPFGQINITDKKVEGNSFLVETRNLEYVFIGRNIFSFTAIAPIKTYFSPEGATDNPYPFAIDSDGYIYLLMNNVIIHPNENTKDLFDKKYYPYSVYSVISCISYVIKSQYKEELNNAILNLMIEDDHKNEIVNVRNKKKITKKKKNKLIKIELYGSDINYNSNPEQYYEMLKSIKGINGEKYSSYLQTSDKKKIKISKKDYVNINNKWGEFFGLQKISGYKELVKRRM